LFLQLGHVQVADFGLLALGQEDVGTLDVAVQDFHLVQVPESLEYVGDLFPYFVFRQHGACFLAAVDAPTQVAVFAEVLNDLQIARLFVLKRIKIFDNVGRADRCEETNFV
jgi:hypothetical protein